MQNNEILTTRLGKLAANEVLSGGFELIIGILLVCYLTRHASTVAPRLAREMYT